MKCLFCKTEYDEKQYLLCPFCHNPRTKKERFIAKVWNAVFQLCALAIGLSAIWGISVIFGKFSLIPGLVLFILFALSNIKRKEKQGLVREVNVRKILDDPKIPEDFKKWKIIQALNKD